MVTALGFDAFAGFRMHVNFDLAGFAVCGAGLLRRSSAVLRIHNGNDAAQVNAILSHQGTEFLFELNFLFERLVVLQCFEFCQMLCQLFFKLTKFCKAGHF
ncbi:hypothetical protein FQZ97_1188260 [compost metagenome]